MSKEPYSQAKSNNVSTQDLKPDVKSSPLTDINSQKKTDEPELLKKSKLVFATRLARAGAAVGAVVYVAGKVGLAIGRAVLAGDFTGIVGAAKSAGAVASSAARAADPLDKLRKGGDIKEKTLPKEKPKWENLTTGQKVKRVGEIAYDTLLSKAAKRVYKSAGVVASVAINPTPVGLGIAAISTTAIVYDVAKETLEARSEKRKETEKDTLQNIKGSKDHQMILLSGAELNTAAEKNPAIKEFIQDTSKSIYAQAETHVPYVPVKSNRGVALAKVLGNNVIEAAAVVAETFSGGIAEKLLSFAVVAGKAGAEADEKLEKIEQSNVLNNKIKNLQWATEPYKNREELKELERQEKVSTEALKRVTEDPSKLIGLSKVQIDAKLAVIQKQVDQEPEFAKPAEKTVTDKIKAGTKEYADAFVEAQFGDLKEVYGLNKDGKPHFEPSTINPEKPNKDPALSQKKAHEMQANLSQNSPAYKTSISPADTPHNEKHHSSKGRG